MTTSDSFSGDIELHAPGQKVTGHDGSPRGMLSRSNGTLSILKTFCSLHHTMYSSHLDLVD